MALAEATISKSRLDEATILVSTSLENLPTTLHLTVNGASYIIKIRENHNEVVMDDDDEDVASSSKVSNEADDVENDLENTQVVASSNFSHDDNQWSPGPECLPQLQEAKMMSNVHVEPCTNGLSYITHRPKCGKKKTSGPSGSIKLDQAPSICDADITCRNKAILAYLGNTTTVIETAKTWDVGSLLALFDDTSRKEIESVLIKNIMGLQEALKLN